jgi:hypothetical protein
MNRVRQVKVGGYAQASREAATESSPEFRPSQADGTLGTRPHIRQSLGWGDRNVLRESAAPLRTELEWVARS